ncbi:alpha/beta fold hydrolase [Candidatus Parcubacteria bacterium]|nr:alpha/beta fold hydrolase [Candidatus Parcubacteria bacterium]
MRSKQLAAALLGLLTVAALGAVAVKDRAAEPSTPPAASPNPAGDAGGPPASPLEIESIRSRSYPGGEIKVEEQLGNQGGYLNYVVSYPSDGLKIYALMSVPAQAKPPAGWPVIVLNHGYIPPRQYRTKGGDYQAFIATYARNGYIVIKPDYRGHDRSEGEPEGGNFSPSYTYDVLNLIASIKRYPDANPRAIGMLGHSMGGSVGLRAIAARADVRASVFAAGVVGSPEDLVYRWRSSASPPPNFVTSVRQRLLERFGEPGGQNPFWRQASPLNYLDGVTGAVQIHHGTNDESVPKLFSDSLAAALVQAGKPHQYYVYEGGDHNFTGPARPLFLQRTLAFFDQHLK